MAFKKARRSINPSLRLFTLSSSQSKSQKCTCSQTYTNYTYTYSYINIPAYNLIDNGDISNWGYLARPCTRLAIRRCGHAAGARATPISQDPSTATMPTERLFYHRGCTDTPSRR